jgi:hypothetical protein
VGVAGAGLLIGHWLAYALVAPQARARDELLAATGHGYLPYATQVAMLAGTLGLAGLFLAGLTRSGARRSLAGDAGLLVAVQSTAYITMEVGERLVSGASLADLSHGPLLAIGLAVQVVVASAGAVLVRLTEGAADAAEAVVGSGARLSPPNLVAVPAHTVLPRRGAVRAAASRAPPFRA